MVIINSNLFFFSDPALKALINTKKLPEFFEVLLAISTLNPGFQTHIYMEIFQKLVLSDKASVKEYSENILFKLAELSKILIEDLDALESIGQLMLAFKSQDDRFDQFLISDKKIAAAYGQICFHVMNATSDSKEESIINTRKAFATLFANLSVIPEFADSIQFSETDAVFELLYKTVTSSDTASSTKGIAYLMIGNFAYTENQATALVHAFPGIISLVINFLQTENLSENNLQSLQLIQNLLKGTILDEFLKNWDKLLIVLKRLLKQQFYPMFKTQAIVITGIILSALGEDDVERISALSQFLACSYQTDDAFEVKSKVIGAISRVSSVISRGLSTNDDFSDAAIKSIELAFDYSYFTFQKPREQWDLFNLLKAFKTLGVFSVNVVQDQPAMLEYIQRGGMVSDERSQRIVHLLSTFSNQLVEYENTLSNSPDEEERGKCALIKGCIMNLAYLASKIQSLGGDKYNSEIIDASRIAIANSAPLATAIQN